MTNEKKFQLTVNKGPHLGKTFDLSLEKVTIGRDAAVDVTFDIPEVSRSHAVITRRGDDYYLQDLGSTNGTYVNEKKIVGQHRLQSGDTIMLSDAVHMLFAVQYDPEATMVATPSFAKKEQGTVAAMPSVPKPARAPAVRPSAPPVAPPPPASQQQYAGRVPAGPSSAQPSAAPPIIPPSIPEEDDKKKTWLWAGVGCLAVVIFLFVIGFVVFDYLNLYCTPPFDTLLSFMYTCP